MNNVDLTNLTDLIADFPAVAIFALPTDHDIRLSEYKGNYRTASLSLRIKSFKRTRPGYEWLSSFTIGCDHKDGVWAYRNATMLTDTPRDKDIAFGAELGDLIRIEGSEYRIEEDHNQNIKLIAV
jgi:hypothetical protein